LPENSVIFETISSETYTGTIEKEAVENNQKSTKSQDKSNANRRLENLTQESLKNQHQAKNDEIKYEAGLIKFEMNGEIRQIPYYTFNQGGKQNKNTTLHYMDTVSISCKEALLNSIYYLF
jgi:hypothetical protein